MAVKQALGIRYLALPPGIGREFHVGRMSPARSLLALSQLAVRRPWPDRANACLAASQELHQCSARQGQDDRRRSHETHFVSLHRLLELIEAAGWASQYRLVVQMTLKVGGQTIGSFVTAGCGPSPGTSSQSSPDRSRRPGPACQLGCPATPRRDAALLPRDVLSRVEGRCGRSSQNDPLHFAVAPLTECCSGEGVEPVSSSYSSTPSQ